MHRFKSTANFDRRHRSVATPVERATFVVFSLGTVRCAAPVEVVDRVLRVESATHVMHSATINFQGQPVRLIDIRPPLQLFEPMSQSPHARVIVFSVLGERLACAVDAVHEVATMDAAVVRPLPVDTSGWWCAGHQRGWPACARGIFSRQGHDVVILDMLRLTRS